LIGYCVLLLPAIVACCGLMPGGGHAGSAMRPSQRGWTGSFYVSPISPCSFYEM